MPDREAGLTPDCFPYGGFRSLVSTVVNKVLICGGVNKWVSGSEISGSEGATLPAFLGRAQASKSSNYSQASKSTERTELSLSESSAAPKTKTPVRYVRPGPAWTSPDDAGVSVGEPGVSGLSGRDILRGGFVQADSRGEHVARRVPTLLSCGTRESPEPQEDSRRVEKRSESDTLGLPFSQKKFATRRNLLLAEEVRDEACTIAMGGAASSEGRGGGPLDSVSETDGAHRLRSDLHDTALGLMTTEENQTRFWTAEDGARLMAVAGLIGSHNNSSSSDEDPPDSPGVAFGGLQSDEARQIARIAGYYCQPPLTDPPLSPGSPTLAAWGMMSAPVGPSSGGSSRGNNLHEGSLMAQLGKLSPDQRNKLLRGYKLGGSSGGGGGSAAVSAAVGGTGAAATSPAAASATVKGEIPSRSSGNNQSKSATDEVSASFATATETTLDGVLTDAGPGVLTPTSREELHRDVNNANNVVEVRTCEHGVEAQPRVLQAGLPASGPSDLSVFTCNERALSSESDGAARGGAVAAAAAAHESDEAASPPTAVPQEKNGPGGAHSEVSSPAGAKRPESLAVVARAQSPPVKVVSPEKSPQAGKKAQSPKTSPAPQRPRIPPPPLKFHSEAYPHVLELRVNAALLKDPSPKPIVLDPTTTNKPVTCHWVKCQKPYAAPADGDASEAMVKRCPEEDVDVSEAPSKALDPGYKAVWRPGSASGSAAGSFAVTLNVIAKHAATLGQGLSFRVCAERGFFAELEGFGVSDLPLTHGYLGMMLAPLPPVSKLELYSGAELVLRLVSTGSFLRGYGRSVEPGRSLRDVVRPAAGEDFDPAASGEDFGGSEDYLENGGADGERKPSRGTAASSHESTTASAAASSKSSRC